MANEITFEIIKHIGIYKESSKGWQGEVNLVSWNGNDPKIDIRTWNEDHTKMSKGMTLTEEEARLIAEMLYRI